MAGKPRVWSELARIAQTESDSLLAGPKGEMKHRAQAVPKSARGR